MHHPDGFVGDSDHAVAVFADFAADLHTGELRKCGAPVALQRQPFEALRTLVLARGRLVTRDALRRALWRDAVNVDFERGLTSAIRKAREALSDSGTSPRFIETLPGRGYRFICPVRFSPTGTQADRAAAPPLAEIRRSWRATAENAIALGLVAGISLSTGAGGGSRHQRPPAPRIADAPATNARAVMSAVPTAESAWSAGLQMLAIGREAALRDAVRWFDRAASLDPAFADAFAAAAEARAELVSRGFAPRALSQQVRELATHALTLNPRSARARIVLARLRIDAGELDMAANELGAAIAGDPTSARARTMLACVRKRQGRFAEAASLAEAALALAPDDPVIVALAGFYAHSALRYDRERELMNRAAAMAPASVDVLWHLALSEARRRDYVGALATLDRALMLAPDAPNLLYWRGYIEAESGRMADARHTLETLRQVSNANAAGGNAVASLQGIVEHLGR